ncbi:MAG: hypothetical protein ACNI22_15300 [Halarcobacter sp.]
MGIFFNIKYIPGIGGKSVIYYHDISNGIIIGSIEMIFGLIIYIYAIKRKRKFQSIEYSKCPKCKETYNYPNLKDGICPKCNIKTINLEKYYNKDDKKEIWEELN